MREIADEGDLPPAEDALVRGFVFTADLRQVYVHAKRSVGRSVHHHSLPFHINLRVPGGVNHV